MNIYIQISSRAYSTVSLWYIYIQEWNGRVVGYVHFDFARYGQLLFKVDIPMKGYTALHPSQLTVCQTFYFPKFDEWDVLLLLFKTNKQTKNRKESKKVISIKKNSNTGFGVRPRFECWHCPWKLCDLGDWLHVWEPELSQPRPLEPLRWNKIGTEHRTCKASPTWPLPWLFIPNATC